MTTHKKSKAIIARDATKLTKGQRAAKFAILPGANASAIASWYGLRCDGAGVDANEYMDMLALFTDPKANRVAISDNLLLAQAYALDTMFAGLAGKAKANADAGYFDAGQAYLKLAMRAQNQCRMTLETLAVIRNPPIFAKQANIANNQQVNNGEAVPVAHVGEAGKPQTELSRLTHDG